MSIQVGSKTDVLHLIYMNGESILLDKDKNIVQEDTNINNAKYLSDITFSSNDIALNTLLSMLPKKIEIHVIDKEDEFINTLKLIFENRIKICSECGICRTYKMLNSVKISKWYLLFVLIVVRYMRSYRKEWSKKWKMKKS